MDLTKIIDSLSKVKGVKAIALGGSQSRNEADAHSDYDIGVYYEKATLDISALEAAMGKLDDEHRNGLLNPPGLWGSWINGGGWLTVDHSPVDILLREIETVKSVIINCIDGKITIDYQCGHPFGFVNAIYAAETHHCKPLWQDSTLPLDSLKALLYQNGAYSPQMQHAIVKKFLWEAWSSLACGRKAALKGDVNYAMGSVFRAVSSWAQVLYALNARYLMNEKGALKWISSFEHKPLDMEVRVKAAYTLFATGCSAQGYELLDGLHSEMEALANEIQQYDNLTEKTD